MAKAKRQRKKELDDLEKWFDEFSVACPWRGKQQGGVMNRGAFCIATYANGKAMICQAISCAPIFIANRLLN